MNELTPAVSELDHHRGALDAPTILVEFGDYECPDTVAVHPVVEQLLAEAGDQLCFVYRHFPLKDRHPNAELAAEAAEAADSQGRFREMHDALFENSPALALPDLVRCFREFGLDDDRFYGEVRSHLYFSRVQLNIESGLQTGVTGTPTFFINGVHYRGSYDFEPMLEALKLARTA